MSAYYTEADAVAASEALWTNWGNNPEAPPADCDWAARIVLDAVAPAIAARAWDEAAEATAEWMWNNPGPSGVPHDPPRNPYA